MKHLQVLFLILFLTNICLSQNIDSLNIYKIDNKFGFYIGEHS